MTTSEELLYLANHLERQAIEDSVIEVAFTPKQRDLIVAGLKAASALRSLAELPQRT